MDCSIEFLSAMNSKIMQLCQFQSQSLFFHSQAAFSGSHISKPQLLSKTSESSFSFCVIASFTVVNILFKLKQGQTDTHTHTMHKTCLERKTMQFYSGDFSISDACPSNSHLHTPLPIMGVVWCSTQAVFVSLICPGQPMKDSWLIRRLTNMCMHAQTT